MEISLQARVGTLSRMEGGVVITIGSGRGCLSGGAARFLESPRPLLIFARRFAVATAYPAIRRNIKRIMKQILSIPTLFLLVATALSAQPLSTAWFAGVGGGLAAHDNGAFSRRLKSYTPAHANGESFLYQTGDFPSTGLTLDAGGGLMVGGGWVIGASGQMVSYPVVTSINGPGTTADEYSLGGSGAGLDVGYALVNDAGTLIFPYLQGGYYGYSLDYTNNQSEAIPFFEGKPVASGATATYTGAAPRLGLGVGLVKLIGVDGAGSTGGMAVTARLSWGMMLSRPEWKEPDGSVVNNGGLTPAYNGVSFSITIGGGMGWR